MKEKLKILQDAVRAADIGHWKLQYISYSDHWTMSLIAHPYQVFTSEDPEELIVSAIKWMAEHKQPPTHKKNFVAYEELSKPKEENNSINT